MSFWDLSDDTKANENTKTEYEVPGGNMEPIPNNSDVLAEIVGVKWDSGKDKDERYISIQWKVSAPQAVKNRVVFQKLWVDDLDPSAKTEDKAREKRDKARRMLATIDANAKGRLMQSNDAPTDDSLALALQGAEMVIKCMVWSIDDSSTGDTITGNWVSAVKPKTAELHVSDEKPKSKPSGGGGRPSGGVMDDEIPWSMEWRV